MNVSILVGRICQDPQLKTVGGGGSVTNFSLAVNSSKKDKDGNYTSDFFNIAAWNKTGEYIAKNLKKGDKIFVMGSLTNNSWVDKNGSKHVQTTIFAQKVELVNGARNRETEPQAMAGDVFTSAPDGFYPAMDDDTTLPFDL